MRSIFKGFQRLALGAGAIVLASTVQADAFMEIENILVNAPEREIRFETVMQMNTNDSAVWALETARKYQERGDFELRNKFLSLALVVLQRDEMTRFARPMSPGFSPRSAQNSRRFQFQRLYGEEGTYGSAETQDAVSEAVQQEVDGEAWFLSVLEKLGVLNKNYKDLNDQLRAEYPNLSRSELADHLVRQAARLTAGVGFASNLPGAIPGVGSAAQMALSVGGMIPDMIYLFKQQATLIFRIAEIYGKDIKSEERVTEALILFGVASGVSSATKALEQYLEKSFTVYLQSKITEEAVQNTVAKLAAMHPLLRDIITTLVSKQMINQAAVEKAANSLIPLIGAGLNGATNYVFTRQVGRVAKAFYGDETTDKLQAINNLKMPKVELAMFRALVSVIHADGVQKPEETMAIQKILGRFEHNRSMVERMLDGDEELMGQTDYDISAESDQVKRHILYAIISMEYVDMEKNPAEIELHDRILEKFAIDISVDREVEARVKEERGISDGADAGLLGRMYRSYQKAIGAREEVDF